jgi:hypothetical protein
MSETRLLCGTELHRVVVKEELLGARKHVWIATAYLKDMHVRRGKRYKPIVEQFDEMAATGVVSTDPARLAELQRQFDRFWIGEHCDDCRLRDRCPDPVR